MRKKQKLLNLLNPILSLLGVRLEFTSKYRTSTPVPLDGSVDLSSLQASLSPRIELAVLGSLGDHFSVPENLAQHVRIFSLDAVSPGSEGGAVSAVVPLKDVVAAQAGPARFVQRVVTGVSSTLEPKQELVEAYALQHLYQVKQEHHVQAVTLGDVARNHQVDHWDYVRTDLEGADFSIIKSLGDALGAASLVEMELRAEPFYEGEPHIHEVLTYMFAHGFEVLDLKPERWRANTPNVAYETRGRVTFCNTVFINRKKETAPPAELLRHALVVGLLGYANVAERLIMPLQQNHGSAVRALQKLFYQKATKPYLPVKSMPQVTHGTSY